jgi:hypothetical protein
MKKVVLLSFLLLLGITRISMLQAMEREQKLPSPKDQSRTKYWRKIASKKPGSPQAKDARTQLKLMRQEERQENRPLRKSS